MAIDRDQLMGWQFPDAVQSYTERDTILYALGLGVGADPLDREQLRFVYEDGLKALPSMGVTLGYPGFWLRGPALGADWKRLLHGEQGIEVMRPLPVAGTVIGRTRVTGVVDKGAGRGALVYTERLVIDAADEAVLCRLTSTSFLRGDGGFSGDAGSGTSPPPPEAVPDRAPDIEHAVAILPQAALIYRLSGDYNPLHADPAIAKAANFERPILHGLCTFGIATWSVLSTVAGHEPSTLAALNVRFTAPVYPGETLVTQIWTGADRTVAFRTVARGRQIVVLDNGVARLR